MSAYTRQMEREQSARSLPSRGNSEMTSSIGSMESGYHVTSFAATVFIGSLVTFGILLVSLLIALTVMLQSCESKNAGIIKIERFCRILDLHAELNGLEGIKYPSMCHDLAVIYVRGGQYERDLNISIKLAEDFFSEIRPLADGLDLILIDIDSVLLVSSSRQRSERHAAVDYIDEAELLRDHSLLKLYRKLQASGWSLGLFTRNHERERKFVTNLLSSAGFRNWSSLIMRLDNETLLSSQEYFSRRRVVLRNAGFRIRGTISSKIDALTGSAGERSRGTISSENLVPHLPSHRDTLCFYGVAQMRYEGDCTLTTIMPENDRTKPVWVRLKKDYNGVLLLSSFTAHNSIELKEMVDGGRKTRTTRASNDHIRR